MDGYLERLALEDEVEADRQHAALWSGRPHAAHCRLTLRPPIWAHPDAAPVALMLWLLVYACVMPYHTTDVMLTCAIPCAGLSSTSVTVSSSDAGASGPACCAGQVLSALFFTLQHDQSVKVRRVAMKVLGSVAVAEGAPAASEMLQVLCRKLRDR